MIEIPLSKATKDQLEAELQMYRDLNNEAIVVPSVEELSNTAKRIDEIKRLREAFGVPVQVTQEFIDANPTLDLSGNEVGSVALLSQDELAASTAANEAAAEKLREDAEDNAGETVNTTGDVVDAENLVYLGRMQVIKVTDAIAHGKMHKDVYTADGQSFRLSEEEYARDVKPRNA